MKRLALISGLAALMLSTTYAATAKKTAAAESTPTITVNGALRLMSKPLTLGIAHYSAGTVTAMVSPGETLIKESEMTVPTVFGNQTWVKASVAGGSPGKHLDEGWVSERALLQNSNYEH